MANSLKAFLDAESTQVEEDGQVTQTGQIPSVPTSTEVVPPKPSSRLRRFLEEEEENHIQNVVKSSQKYEPDRFAKATELGKEHGLNGQAAYDELDLLERRKDPLNESLKKALTKNPEMKKLSGDPNFMGLVHDELDLIDRLNDISYSMLQAVPSYVGRFVRSSGEYIDISSRVVADFIADALPEGAIDKTQQDIPWYLDVPTALTESGGAIENVLAPLPEARQGFHTDVARGVVELPLQIAAFVANPALGSSMMFMQGAEQQGERVKALREQGKDISPGQEFMARTVGGGITWGTEKIPMGFFKEFLPEPLQDKLNSAIGGEIVDRFISKLDGKVQGEIANKLIFSLGSATAEGAQEFIEGTLQEIASRVMLEPDNPVFKGWEEELKELGYASGVASTSSGIFSLMLSLAMGRKVRNPIAQMDKAEKLNQDLGDLASLSKEMKLKGRDITQFKALIKANYGELNLKISQEGMTEMFQSLTPEEHQQLLEDLPYLKEQGRQADTLGTDIEIPIEDYAAYIAPTPSHDVVSRHVTTEYGDVTLAQAEADREVFFNQVSDELKQEFEQEETLSEVDQVAQEAYQHIQQQLVKAGQSLEVADLSPELYRNVVRAYAGQGYDAQTIAQAIKNIIVRNPLSVQADDIDTLLMDIADVQAGALPGQAEMFGESLLDFLRRTGISDEGGELASRDVDVALAPFQRKLIQERGVDLDRAVELAIDAGYLPGIDPAEATPQDLLDAIDRELAGERVYSEQYQNREAIERYEYLEDMSQYIDDLGLTDAAPEDIRDAILRDTQTDDDTTTLAQDYPPTPDNYTVNEEPLELDLSTPSYEQAAENPVAANEASIMKLRSLEASVLANAMVADFDSQAATRLVGASLLDSHDLAAMGQVYRNPSFETFRIFYIKDNQVIHQDGITSRAVGSSGIFAEGESFEHAQQLKDELGADGYYLLHNHPTGNVEMSGADGQVTSAFANEVEGFLGHVIINGEKYNVLDAKGNETIFDLPADARNVGYELGVPSIDSPFIGSPVENPTSVAVIGKQFQKPDLFTLIGRDSRGKITTIMDVPLDSFNRSDAEIQAVMNELSRRTGSREFFAANIPDSYNAQFERGLQNGLFLDVVAQDGRSYRQRGVFAGREPARPARRTMYQGRDDKRGSIELPPNVLTEQTAINLFEQSDLTTFLHETGHFFLELQKELAKQGGFAAQEHEKVKDWWLSNADDLAKEAGLPVKKIKTYIERGELPDADEEAKAATALHEQFARGFESYLMTGKPPSLKLVGAFERFKAWLLDVYKNMRRLNVNVTEELRGVFDRMLAVDEDIAQANEEMNYVDTLAQSELLNDEEKQQLQEQSVKAAEESKAQLLRTSLRNQREKLSKKYKAREKVVKQQVENEVRARKPYRTQKLIIFGVDPDDNKVDAKLNTAMLKNMVGESAVKALGKKFGYGKYGITRKDGVNPVQVANTMGYGSVNQMVDDLLQLPKFSETVEAETNQIMQAEFSDVKARSIDEAIKVAHGNERQKLLENELDILTTQAGVRTTSSQLMQAAAKRHIQKQKISNILPHRYKQAEIKAARDAEKAILAGDVEAARLAKGKQLMNFHLFKASEKAREYVEVEQRAINKYRRPKVRKLVDPEFMEQIDGILFNFEFRTGISQKALDKSKAVASFVRRQEDEGRSIYLSDKMIYQIENSYKEHYRNLPFNEFQEISDAIKNLRHLSDVKMKLKSDQEKRKYEANKANVVNSIINNNPLKGPAKVSRSTLKDRISGYMDASHAWLVTPEMYFKMLDGDEIGPAYNAMFKPLSEAADRATQWKIDLGKWFNEFAAKHYSQTELARFSGAGAKRYYISSIGESLSKEEILGAALNTGNENNRTKLLDGYQWHETQLAEVLNQMEKRDWDFVQGLWDKIDTEFWGELSALEKRLNGVVPEKVEAVPFQNQYGVYKGGYWPIKYDAKDDPQVQKFEDAANVKELLGGQAIHAQTRQGHAQARVVKTGKRIRLDFQRTLSVHINDMVQDITHREPIMDVFKIITDKEVADAMISTYGDDIYKTLKPWMGETVGAGRELASAWDRLIRHMRVGTSIVTMGLSMKTALQNYTGLFVSMTQVPVKTLGKRFIQSHIAGITGATSTTLGWTARKIGVPEAIVAKYVDRFNRKPWTYIDKQKEILAASPYLRNRANVFDHDINIEMKKLSIKGKLTPSSTFMFGLIALIDKAVSIPTWQAAYEDGIANKNMSTAEAIVHADSVVRLTQGSGRTVDLSRVASDQKTISLFTSFFSYFNAMYNQFWRSKKLQSKAGWGSRKTRTLAEMALIWIAPAILAEWIAGRAPEDEEDYEAWALRMVATYPLMTLPIVRDIATPLYASYDDTAPQYGYKMSPLAMGGESLVRAGGAYADGEISESEARAMFIASGYWLHLPGAQAHRTSEHLYNVATGENDFSFYDMLYGEK